MHRAHHGSEFRNGALEFIDLPQQSFRGSGGSEGGHALQGFQLCLSQIEFALLFRNLFVESLTLLSRGAVGLLLQSAEVGSSLLHLLLRTGEALDKARPTLCAIHYGSGALRILKLYLRGLGAREFEYQRDGFQARTLVVRGVDGIALIG